MSTGPHGLQNAESTRPPSRAERRAAAAAGIVPASGDGGAQVITLPTQHAGSPIAMPLTDLIYNPHNPRDIERADVSDLSSIQDKQLQAARGVSMGAFLKLWPEFEGKVGDAKGVTVLGNRRHKACGVYGVPTLDIVIDDSMARSKAEFLKWTLLENLARESLNIIEEARGIDAMVAELGTAGAVAKQLDKSDGFVSQRRSLLKLTPELQAAMITGELMIEQARDLARLPTEEQVRLWLKELEAREDGEAQAEDAAAKPKPKPVRAPATVPQVTKTLKKWGAPVKVMAPALFEVYDDTEMNTLLGALMQMRSDRLTEKEVEAEEAEARAKAKTAGKD